MKFLSKFKIHIPLVFLFLIFSCFQNKSDCSVLRHCKLKYLGVPDKSAYMEINGNKVIEYANDKKVIIKSDLVWITDCNYQLTMKESNISNGFFQKGKVLDVKILKIKQDTVDFIGKVDNIEYNGQLLIIK